MNFRNASNNEAKYEALLHGMRMAKACGATLKVHGAPMCGFGNLMTIPMD
jgi:hypothetical protein